ncbi:high mobility group B protein 1 isoform X2 [Phoenix dactylifera]|uniref:High mobility group B protein 1 isoform X2 n=1 Tax=Phoenix dactylifera TaxID=42345 RepID=A0A8B8J0L6_PHODC|nr:high mobility group B protein 1 isoform X2 [Phoenix dactylifera]
MKGGKGKGATKKETKEAMKPADDRKVGKRKAAIKADKSSKRRTKKEPKAKKDPNKPKRPASAFFVFLEEFRKQYKQEHPNVKAVSVEKAPYEAKAAKRKSEYEKQMSAYNKKQESVADDGDDESDRSKSEVNDEDEEESGEVVGCSITRFYLFFRNCCFS